MQTRQAIHQRKLSIAATISPIQRLAVSAIAAAMLLFGVAFYSPPADAGALWQSARQAALRKKMPPAPAAPTARSALPTSGHAHGKPHDVYISRSKHPESARHFDDAQRQGQPSIGHIDRAGASERRRQSTGSVDLRRKPGPHYDRDEVPPALVREGGRNANVRYIPRADNRGAGGSIAAQTRHLEDGSKVRFVVTD